MRDECESKGCQDFELVYELVHLWKMVEAEDLWCFGLGVQATQVKVDGRLIA